VSRILEICTYGSMRDAGNPRNYSTGNFHGRHVDRNSCFILQYLMTIETKNYSTGADSWTQRKGVNGKIKLTILAAGLGKRMEPLTTHHLPKPMFPIGGSVPMVEKRGNRPEKPLKKN
jgi:hypothetical protein